MTTYTQSSHPLDVAAGIASALDTDDLRAMLADMIHPEVLDALIDWLDREVREAEAERDQAVKDAESYIDQIEKLQRQQ